MKRIDTGAAWFGWYAAYASVSLMLVLVWPSLFTVALFGVLAVMTGICWLSAKGA